MTNVAASQGFAPVRLSGGGGTLLVGLGASAPGEGQTELVWIDRDGTESPVDDTWSFDEPSTWTGFDLSPDGTRLAIGLRTDDDDDVWIKELPNGPLSRLTRSPDSEARPAWTSDGQHVAYLSIQDDTIGAIFMRRADGTGTPAQIFPSARHPGTIHFSRDGRWVLARVGNPIFGDDTDIIAYRLEGDTTALPLLTEPYAESTPTLSPDGRWLAYVSDESGTPQVYVRPFPDIEAGKVQVSTESGVAPMWAHRAAELIYLDVGPSGTRVIAATFALDDGFRIVERAELFTKDRVPYGNFTYMSPWALMPDDQRFLARRPIEASDPGTQRIVLVENWFTELEEQLRP